MSDSKKPTWLTRKKLQITVEELGVRTRHQEDIEMKKDAFMTSTGVVLPPCGNRIKARVKGGCNMEPMRNGNDNRDDEARGTSITFRSVSFRPKLKNDKRVAQPTSHLDGDMDVYYYCWGGKGRHRRSEMSIDELSINHRLGNNAI